MAAHIPYGAYWSTPFAKWQGSLAHLNAIELAAATARRELARRAIAPERIDFAVLGTTIPQRNVFYGVPWLMGSIGAGHVGGPTIAQACATGARCLQTAAAEIAGGGAELTLVVAADRTSNGPHIYYPAPNGPGGTGQSSDWVLESFGHDPHAKVSMTRTAENVARKYAISMEEQHDLVLRRHGQYRSAPAGFHARFMTLPFEVPPAGGSRKGGAVLAGDEGVTESTAAGLARLRPVLEGGTVTFGGQTHPADGNAGMIVTTADHARTLSTRPEIGIELVGFGMARVEPAYMPEAPVPATRRALELAGLRIGDIAAVKSHNPFAVNDIVFARETGYDLAAMNNNGCSLIWGHPQGPTGLRCVIELIEELVERGGGTGLFQGCAAGDTAMAVLIRVGDA